MNSIHLQLYQSLLILNQDKLITKLYDYNYHPENHALYLFILGTGASRTYLSHSLSLGDRSRKDPLLPADEISDPPEPGPLYEYIITTSANAKRFHTYRPEFHKKVKLNH